MQTLINPLSIQTITAIQKVLVDGTTDDEGQPVGRNRSGAQLQVFMGTANLFIKLEMSSRNKATLNSLLLANQSNEKSDSIIKVIEQLADPREYNDDELHARTVAYLNRYLVGDGFEIKQINGKYKLYPCTTLGMIASDLSKKANYLDFDSVKQEIQRAIDQADSDPEDAITAACSLLESVCKCLLDELHVEYPSKQDISGLYRAIATELNLSLDREDLDQDTKRILGGLFNVTCGIGSLRTHTGDAHGRGKVVRRVDSRIARLAIHSASSVAFFLLETWEKRHATSLTK